jgi:hypothetical protein
MHSAKQQIITFKVAHIKNWRVYCAIDDVDQPFGRDRRGCGAIAIGFLIVCMLSAAAMALHKA